MVRPLPKHRARDYETIFIVHPDTQVEAIEQVAGRVTDAIDRLEGKLLKAENWGKRRLAYPVAKQAQGYYVYLRYLGYSDLVHEIERNLRMMEPVIKYLTVKIDEDVDPAARPVTEGDISFAPQIEEEPEPEAPEATEETVAEASEGSDDAEATDADENDDAKEGVDAAAATDDATEDEAKEEKKADGEADAEAEESDSAKDAEEEEAE